MEAPVTVAAKVQGQSIHIAAVGGAVRVNGGHCGAQGDTLTGIVGALVQPFVEQVAE